MNSVRNHNIIVEVELGAKFMAETTPCQEQGSFYQAAKEPPEPPSEEFQSIHY